MKEELKGEADKPLIASVMRYELRLAMLRNRICAGPPAELNWVIAETNASSDNFALMSVVLPAHT
ncbi:MAG: hypothetical protein R3C11_01755 [Planctomycetaceae bacterium]